MCFQCSYLWHGFSGRCTLRIERIREKGKERKEKKEKKKRACGREINREKGKERNQKGEMKRGSCTGQRRELCVDLQRKDVELGLGLG
jgi:hypothetical protein